MVKTQNGIAKSNKKAVSRTLRLVRIAIFVALIIVGAFVKFPIGIVPVSMQFAFSHLSCSADWIPLSALRYTS